MGAPDSTMSQNIDISKFSTLINGGETEFLMSASFPNTYGKVTAQFFSNIACTTPVGSPFDVNGGAVSLQQKIPVGALGVIITMSNTCGIYTNIMVRNICFQILNNFPKIAAIAAQTTRQAALTVPVYVYYTTASATLTATSSDQAIVPNSGIAVGGSGFDRNVTFTPLMDGNVTITVSTNDGVATATQTFTVTVHEPVKITEVDAPTAGYYTAGGNLDFTVHFSHAIKGGTGSTLPITVGGSAANAAYLTGTTDSITYRYTLGSSDTGTVEIGSAIDDTSSVITDTADYTAELDISAAATNITVIPTSQVTSSATGGSAVYGTQITFVAELSCASTLSGTIQFKANGVNIGSPVTLSGNKASYQTETTTLDAGLGSITAEFIPSGANFHFTSLTSGTCAVNIAQKSVSVSDLVAVAKTYDGSTNVTLSGGTLTGILTGDTVSALYPSAGTAAQKNVGTQSVAFTAITLTGTDKDNYILSTQPSVSVVISPQSLTVTAGDANRTYNGTNTATAAGVTFDGLVLSETLASGVDYTATGVFDSADVGSDIPVTITVSLTVTTKAKNYTLSSGVIHTTANITQKAVSITGVAATPRTYDGTLPVALSGGTLSGVETADAANVGFELHTGTMADAKAGNAKPVTTNITLTGSRAGNYSLTQPTDVTVNNNKVALSLHNATVSDKAYDGTKTATVTDVAFDGLVLGESLTLGIDCTATGLFDSADVDSDVTVAVTVVLTGTNQANNYSLSSNVVNTTANITQNGVTLSGVTATNRAYNGTVSVALTGGTLSGIKATDAASVGFDLHNGSVSDAKVGNAKPVVTNITLTGSKASNYTLTQPTGIKVNITPAGLSLHSATVPDKTYDGTKNATVTSVSFDGLVSGESLALGVDYTVAGSFSSANVGSSIPVTITVSLTDTDISKNYTVNGSGSVGANITKRPSPAQ